MPRSFVTSTHAAPSSRRYASAWSSTLLRSAALSSRSRNCGTSALTALIPANVAVRPARNACTPRRTPASARRIDSSAVRFACSEVSPSVTPSTPATDNMAAMKILAPRPIRAILVALASGIRRVVFAVLVLMGRPAEPASVERQLDPRGAGRRHAHRLRDFRTPLVPGVQHPCARRHGGDFEAAVRGGLREVTTRHHLHERHHSGVDVAEDAHQAGTRERPGLGLAAAVLPEVERIGPGGGAHVVVEGIVIREADRRTEWNDHDAGHELLIVDRDVDGHRAGGIVRGPALEVHDRGRQVGRRLPALLEQRHPARDAPLRDPALHCRDTTHAYQPRDPSHRLFPVALEALQLTVVISKPPGARDAGYVAVRARRRRPSARGADATIAPRPCQAHRRADRSRAREWLLHARPRPQQ